MSEWRPFNVNHKVKVRLTELGQRVVKSEGLQVSVDAEGWSEWQLWELMNVLGPHCIHGNKVPFQTEILVQL